MLTVTGLTKIFSGPKKKKTIAVDNIAFGLSRGEIVGLLGPNGAGKTTTAQMLLGTLTPTDGSIKYFGDELATHREQILGRINFASAYTRLPWRMTVRENLMVYAVLYGIPNKQARIKRFLEEFGVWQKRDAIFGSLSAGQKTRVMLAKAFLNHPEVLLLDEPTASLDPDIALDVRRFLAAQQKEFKVAMLFTSHNMAEVEEVCDRVVFLAKGKIVAEDTPAGLARSIKLSRLHLRLDQGREKLTKIVREMGLEETEEESGEVKIELQEDRVAECLTRMAQAKIAYTQISIEKPTLEDYFVKMSGGGQV